MNWSAHAGLTDELRNNRNFMQDLAKVTRMEPQRKFEKAKKLLRDIQTNPNALKVI